MIFRAFAKAFDCLPTLFAVVLPLFACSASGADDPPYLVEFRAYKAALDAHDITAAETHARAAWQAAEDTLGNHRLTAILAYNYGRMVLFDDDGSALAPLRRARELHEADVADLSANKVQLYSDYAEFTVSERKERDADRLRETLDAVGIGAAGVRSDLATMWLSLATSDIINEEYPEARKSAAQAEAAILKAGGDERSRASAILIGAIARVVPYPKEAEDVKAAHDDLVDARSLFPLQDDLDSFDPLLAKIIAWEAATNVTLKMLHFDEPADVANAETQSVPPLFKGAIGCEEVEWVERIAPEYPSRALRQGTIGAVVVGFRIGDDFRIRDARVLAEVPGDTFGEGVLESISGWQAKELPADPACHQNLTTAVMFMLEK